MANLFIFLVSMLTGAPATGVSTWTAGPNAQQPKAYPFTLDFENGDLKGWTAIGNAFTFQPTLDDNPTARNRGERPNHRGRYWIGTFERYQGRPGQRRGDTQGDSPRGTLTSADFVVPTGTLSFLVGGGASLQTRVELRVWDQIESVWATAFRASGKNSETMSLVRWDLSKYVGRTARLLVVDSSAAGWGHINVDNFSFSGPSLIPFDSSGVMRAPFTPQKVLPQQATPQQTLTVRIPDLTGRRLDVARGILDGVQLRLRQVSSKTSSQSVGTIIDQAPPPDSLVPRGSAVSVVIAAGVRAPNLVGRNRAEIEAVLRAARLTLGQPALELSRLPTGSVIRQDPLAGTEVPLGSAVNVVVASGVKVPDLNGRLVGLAGELLSQQRLKLGEVNREPSASQPETVVRQSVSAGVEVPLETVIDVWVAAPIPVPNLIGQDRGVSETILTKARLNVGAITTRPSERLPGTVIDQTPAAGSLVRLGTRIDLVIADAVPVPDIIGLDSVEAGQRIASSGLQLGSVSREPSDQPTGTVIEQKPTANTAVPLSTEVDVVIAEGIPVPNVIGLVNAEARQRLVAGGLGLGSVRRKPSERPAGTVIDQEPQPGALVPLRTPVALVIAAPVAVPNLVGRNIGQARQIIESSQLAVGEVLARPSPQPAGVVLEQAPDGSAQVPLRTAIDLVVAAGVAVPGLVGHDSAAAIRLLSEAGLRPGKIEGRPSSEPAGIVLVQNPLSQDQVPLGSLVDLVIAVAVQVPYLLDLDRATAQERLSEVGLEFVANSRKLSFKPGGTVLAQQPTPGSLVPLASQVSVTVARHVPLGGFGAGLLTLVAASVLFVRTRVQRRSEYREDRQARRVEVRARPDPGIQTLEAATPPASVDFRLRTVVDPGEQQIETAGSLLERIDE